MALAPSLSPESMQQEVNALKVKLAEVTDFSEVFRKLGNDLENLQGLVQGRVKKLGKELNRVQVQVHSAMARYFELRGDLVVFQHTDEIAKGINDLIKNIRQAAREAANIAQKVAQEIERAATKAAKDIEAMIKKLAKEAKEILKKCDLTMLLTLWGKSLSRDMSPLIATLSSQLSARVGDGLGGAVDAIAKRIIKETKGVAQKIGQEAKKYAQEADKFARDVKKKTPGPVLVNFAIKMVMRGNAFNWKKRRFEYQGRFGLVTGTINYGLNRAITSVERKVPALVTSYLTNAIADQLVKKGMPEARAQQVAGYIVNAMASKFA